jgi:hypothetical protein
MSNRSKGREVDVGEHAVAEDVGAAVAEHAVAEHAVAEDAIAVAEPGVAEDAAVGHAAAEHAAVEHAVAEHAAVGERAGAEHGVAEDVPVGAGGGQGDGRDSVMAESSMARPSMTWVEQRVRVRELDLHVLHIDDEQGVVQAEVHGHHVVAEQAGDREAEEVDVAGGVHGGDAG